MNRKGISLIVLVTTVVLLILLVSVVTVKVIDTSDDQKRIMFFTDMQASQVYIDKKIALNKLKATSDFKSEDYYMWEGIIQGYEPGNTPRFNITNVVPNRNLAKLSSLLGPYIHESLDIDDLYIDENGILYHSGIRFNDTIYYNKEVNSDNL